MSDNKYVGLDVHQSSTVAAVHNSQGKRLMGSIIETKGEAIRDFIGGLRGTVHVTFEEGTHAAWLYDVIKPLVAEVIVCNPRANKLLASGSKSDRVDANKLAQLLRLGELKPVYHGGASIRPLKELVHNYDSILGDTTRVMNRLKALFRGRAIRCGGRDVYYQRNREQWIERVTEPGARRRVEFLYEELDHLTTLRREAKKEMLKEARRHAAYRQLRQVPVLGPIRVAAILAAVVSPHRFRTKRQLWAYCGLAVTTRSSGEYRFEAGGPRRQEKKVATRGLNQNYNHRLKYVFKSAALAGIHTEPFASVYQRRVEDGMRPEMARLTLARKIAAITLRIWKKKEGFNDLKVRTPAA
ncbi:MAG: IS110 family transposase [Chloroflexi bacterium]|nr:IS110 family transposase [Chloroflexota bacterium]